MIYYAVIDTNVLVSYFITKNTDSPKTLSKEWPCRISSRNDDNYRTGNDSARIS